MYSDAEDYLEMIATPMDLSTLLDDVESNVVQTLRQFLERIDLIVANALQYNAKGVGKIDAETEMVNRRIRSLV
jgi:hypothetical protein